jgi:hypothetical protein
MIGGSGIFNAQRPGHNERNIPAPPRPSQDPFTVFLGLTLSLTLSYRTDPFTKTLRRQFGILYDVK